jgi:hypothetical protein
VTVFRPAPVSCKTSAAFLAPPVPVAELCPADLPDIQAYGHFGRPEFSWEKTDRAEALKKAIK